jgi:hypothetical protein
VEHILLHNLAQARLKSPDSNVYELRFDPNRHEMGDNDSRFESSSKTTDPCGCHECFDEEIKVSK